MSSLRIDEALRAARLRIDSTDAELLLAHVLGASRSWLFAHARDVLPSEPQARFEALVARRAEGEPVAYLVGHRGFWSLDLQVTPATLIPRPETELLVELALERLPPERTLRVADLGTGSGAIALAIARERAHAEVVATDASAAALAVAQANAARHGLHNVVFREGRWCAPLGDEHFDLIASNPPYIADDDVHLGQGDLRYEPRSALAAGPDGLDDVRIIVAEARAHLRSGGWLLLEHGFEQGSSVRALLEGAGFTQVETRQDLEGRDRVTLGRHD
jgi:release factor glutamine methyltransferase